MRTTRALTITTLLGALLVGPLAVPASAAVTTSTSGTILTVNVTGNEYVRFDCLSGNVAVNSVVAAPALSCATLTRVNLTGDAGNQLIFGADLGRAEFTAVPRIVADLGDGADYATETPAADSFTFGPGDDTASLVIGGLANSSMALGTGTSDGITLDASAGNDSIAVTSNSALVSITTTNIDGTSTTSASGGESLSIYSGGGNDTVTTAAVTAASTLAFISLDGGEGDDDLTMGPKGGYAYGGIGTNHFHGSSARDTFWSSSDTDVLDGGSDAVAEYLYDIDGLRSGSRTITGFGAQDSYSTQASDGDVVVRIRPGATPGTTLQTLSLHRPGQQVIPASLGTIAPSLSYVGEVPHRGLIDVVGVSQNVFANLPLSDDGILDITIPTGTWTLSTVGTTVSVAPNDAYGPITGYHVGDYRVHGPWTNRNQGFAHRVYRDLLFRFASNSTRDAVRDQLTAGTKTRTQIAAGIVNSDEYRGLDVDRTFVDYLNRRSDPAGRDYWIRQLRGAKSLRQFRGLLFGSNEYFTKAGGTNDRYVEQAYADVLGRAPDTAGKAYWVNKINTGTDRGVVALQFLSSTEARRNIVKNQFLRFLDRQPTATEASRWVTNLNGATGEQDLVTFLAASTGYYTRS